VVKAITYRCIIVCLDFVVILLAHRQGDDSGNLHGD